MLGTNLPLLKNVIPFLCMNCDKNYFAVRFRWRLRKAIVLSQGKLGVVRAVEPPRVGEKAVVSPFVPEYFGWRFLCLPLSHSSLVHMSDSILASIIDHPIGRRSSLAR